MSLLTKPIGDINWDDVEAFCQQRIPEGAFLDYKEDFPENLEKTLAAIANTLGGAVLLGVEEDSESKPIVPIKGIDFKRGLSERVINIILSNITPPFIPEVQVARDAPDKRAAVIIRIPQSPQTPHAIAANTQVYYRTGNRNQPEALASIDRIEWLIDRRKKSEDFRERLYKQAEVRLGSLYDASLTRRREKGEAIEKIQEGLLSIYSCPLYPRERFKLPPEMMQIFLESRVDDYYSDNYFPIPSGTDKTRMAQDGLVSHLSGQSLYHTELNCFGLYFFRQSIVRDYPDAGRIIYDAEIFARLDEFVDSAINLDPTKKVVYW